MGVRGGRSRAGSLYFNALLIVAVVCCIAPVAATPECRTTEECCVLELRGCWILYGRAKDTLGVRDEFSVQAASGRARTRAPGEVRARCTAMRTFSLCIGNQSRLCHGNLNYHSAHRGIERQMKRYNCSMHGELFRPDECCRPGRGRADDCKSSDGCNLPDVCAYRKSSGGARAQHRLCALFGDPHLRTFDGELETCSAQGAWPLIDNKHLTVQVTNEPLTGSKGRATAITKITVMVKQHSECASSVFVTYQASAGELPGAFDDGSVELGGSDRGGGGSGVRLREQSPGRHVEIHLRYVDTTVVLRRTGPHYSVVVRMPAAIMNASIADDPDGLQMCVRGCPHSERIDYREFLAMRNTRLKQQRQQSGTAMTSVEVTSPSSSDKMTRDEAASRCCDAGVVDYFFDACVFDLVSTGDQNFTLAARHAQRDTLRLLPESAATLRNRTSFAELDQSYWNGGQRTSGRACVTAYVLVTLCALLVSELLTSAAGGATWPRERCRGT